MQRGMRVALAGAAAWIVLGLGLDVAAQGLDGEAARRLQGALAVQAATRAHLRLLGDATTCADARFVSYRRSDKEPDVVDQWYVASQLWADAQLTATASGAPTPPTRTPTRSPTPLTRTPTPTPTRPPTPDELEARCHLDKGFIFLDRLWDYSTGGYYPLSDPSGTAVVRGVRYSDDNALAGLSLLAAAASQSDPLLRQRYLHAARREAEFLTESGLWDGTFGGGFWWTTNKGDTPEGKPAHTNALAALFFARLHNATNLEADRAWALRTLLWLDTILYDPSKRLYRWSVGYQDREARLGAILSERYFNYDQGIAIEAQTLAARLDGDPNRLPRARGVGEALHEAFWGRELGGYNLEAGIEQVYTAFAAWTSLGHLALHDADGDARWLDLARRNADALTASLRGVDGAYAQRHYRCVDRRAPGCESVVFKWAFDQTRDTAAQAWIQHLQTAIARRTAPPRLP